MTTSPKLLTSSKKMLVPLALVLITISNPQKQWVLTAKEKDVVLILTKVNEPFNFNLVLLLGLFFSKVVKSIPLQMQNKHSERNDRILNKTKFKYPSHCLMEYKNSHPLLLYSEVSIQYYVVSLIF